MHSPENHISVASVVFLTCLLVVHFLFIVMAHHRFYVILKDSSMKLSGAFLVREECLHLNVCFAWVIKAKI